MMLRQWQGDALREWIACGYKGIVSAVTGSGKTVFALACIDTCKPDSTLIVVPTAALLDQWWEEVANFFKLDLDEIHIITGNKRIKRGTINISVINTAAKLAQKLDNHPTLLIVDECHRSGAETFRSILSLPKIGSLGLSATPERPYDDSLSQIIEPALGNVIYKYDYASALKDGVIVPFTLVNVVFDLEPDARDEYEKLTRRVARSIDQYGIESDETLRLFLRRSRVLSRSQERVRIALKIVAQNLRKKILIFHEDIESCEVISHALTEFGIKTGIYHSRQSLKNRAMTLSAYRSGAIDVLVTCRALDEGFNVPETEIGIIAASTATDRQRIQRLGRILRPSVNKNDAIVYTLVATDPEVQRLKHEEEMMEGVAHIEWRSA